MAAFVPLTVAAPVQVVDERARRVLAKLGKVVAGFVAFMVLGNLAIVGASFYARRLNPAPAAPAGIKNFRIVDNRLWRGAAPTAQGYRSLAMAGVTTVVDLRAEDDLHVDDAMLSSLGIRRIHMPVRDGQAPGEDKVERFIDIVRRTDGPVFVHCGAGVGRTGSMVAAYLVGTGQAGLGEALRFNLSVGPPSLEQLAFVAGGISKPNTALTAISRTLDAPRRIWSRLR